MNKTKKSYDNPSTQIKINICRVCVPNMFILAGPPYGEVKYKQDTHHANCWKFNFHSDKQQLLLLCKMNMLLCK